MRMLFLVLNLKSGFLRCCRFVSTSPLNERPAKDSTPIQSWFAIVVTDCVRPESDPGIADFLSRLHYFSIKLHENVHRSQALSASLSMEYRFAAHTGCRSALRGHRPTLGDGVKAGSSGSSAAHSTLLILRLDMLRRYGVHRFMSRLC
ncbi:hypothetical protein [Burkholderia aenigmatica]|uniref:hypothetical protein n=1 Tax=Burkholderia aenigmatica TaxID=2015348 RepID=UPI003CC837A0